LAIHFDQNITYIDHEEPIHSYKIFNELPDKCPICYYSISPEYIFFYKKSPWEIHLLCGCPRNECGSLFFAEYHFSGTEAYFTGCFPRSKDEKKFPKEIEELSPDFISIFNQSHHAEQEKLDLICGVGYRKALEYLIKDYVLMLHPTEENRIKKMPLQQCIQNYISELSIKNMAERATWLGNDETHYVRKWEDRDIQDLKNLIDLTVYFISMSLKASKYEQEMLQGKT
jgi:hypothetical protein